MAVVNQLTPPPSLEQLSQLQLMRTSLVNFVDWKDFSDVVTGCYVRVLLEMRTEDRPRNNTDSYYITCVKGAKRGASYTGFSCDGAETDWQIIIDLPPCFRATTNGNVVQLNSISNSAFRTSEYHSWINACKEAKQPFPTSASIDFRLSMLCDHKKQAMTPAIRKRKLGEDPHISEARDQKIEAMRERIKDEINTNFQMFPHTKALRQSNLEELQDTERQVLDLISKIRLALNDRSKCIVCRQHLSTVVCYPCKHQVLCKHCKDKTEACPVEGCTVKVQQKFEPFGNE